MLAMKSFISSKKIKANLRLNVSERTIRKSLKRGNHIVYSKIKSKDYSLVGCIKHGQKSGSMYYFQTKKNSILMVQTVGSFTGMI